MSLAQESSSPTFCVSLLQLFSDKTHTSLGSAAVVGYPVHLVLLNYDDSFREYCIRSGLSCVGFLPVEMERAESGWGEQAASLPSKATERTARKTLLHEAFKEVLAPLNDTVKHGFPANLESGELLRCFPVLVCVCCDLPEAKDLCAMKNSSQTKYPCHRCMWCRGGLETSPYRTVRMTRMLRERSRGRGSASESSDPLVVQICATYGDGSLTTWTSFLETSPLVLPDHVHSLYDCFGFEVLHNLHLGISKLLKLAFLDLCSKRTRIPGFARGIIARTLFVKICNDYVAEIDRWYPLPGVRLDFSPHAYDGREDGFINTKGLKGMMEGKTFRNLDIVFPMLCSILDSVFADGHTCPLTSTQVAYNKVLQVALERPSGVVQEQEASERAHRVGNAVHTFVQCVEHHLSSVTDGFHGSLKYHLLNHAKADVAVFGSLHPLSSATY